MEENTKKKTEQKIIVKPGINYKKLAAKIVKAQIKAEEDLKQKQGKTVSNLFAIIISVVFGAMGVLSLLIATGGVITFIQYLPNSTWFGFDAVVNSIGQIIAYIVLIIILLLFATILFVSAKDISKEKDRNYIVSVFSALTSLAAFILALIALKS